MQKNEYIKQIFEYVSMDLKKSVKNECNISELIDGKKLLIIKSSNNQKFREMYEKLSSHNKQISIAVFCEESDKEQILEIDPNIELYYHEGRIEERNIKDYIATIPIKEMDRICFMNYEINRETYINVESLCRELTTINKIPVFAYLVNEKKFIQFNSISMHISSLKCYCALADWIYDGLEYKE